MGKRQALVGLRRTLPQEQCLAVGGGGNQLIERTDCRTASGVAAAVLDTPHKRLAGLADGFALPQRTAVGQMVEDVGILLSVGQQHGDAVGMDVLQTALEE